MTFIGDIHGKWDPLAKAIWESDVTDETYIGLGDFGIGFNYEQLPPAEQHTEEHFALENLRQVLHRRRSRLFVLRGNHDNPACFDGTHNASRPYVTFVPDYTVLKRDGLTVLMVGGAISIDRLIRNEAETWWSGEAFVWDPVRFAEATKGIEVIDIVATHSAPEFCEPRTKSGLAEWSRYDPELLTDCAEERAGHTQLFEAVRAMNPEAWFYGHFHDNVIEQHHGIEFRMLAELQMTRVVPHPG